MEPSSARVLKKVMFPTGNGANFRSAENVTNPPEPGTISTISCWVEYRDDENPTVKQSADVIHVGAAREPKYVLERLVRHLEGSQ
jgi:hypothetical protein